MPLSGRKIEIVDVTQAQYPGHERLDLLRLGVKHVVQLTDAQRAELEGRFAGALTLRQRNRIQVLLRSDAGQTDAAIAADLGLSPNTAANVRKRFAAGGLEAALIEKPRGGGPAVLDGKAEALVIALACTEAPEGQTRWTAGLLDRRRVDRESVSEDTVLRVLKKATSSRGRSSPGACPRG